MWDGDERGEGLQKRKPPQQVMRCHAAAAAVVAAAVAEQLKLCYVFIRLHRCRLLAQRLRNAFQMTRVETP